MQRSVLNLMSIIRSVAAILLVSVIFFSISSDVFAAYGINRQINFQGKLVDDDGLTVADDTYSIIFTFYNAAESGTTLWTETDSVTTVNGIFRVPLGAVTPIPANFNFNWDGLYLGIKISTEENEMAPRIQMTAVPMAFNAQQVAGLTVQDENGLASTSGTLKVPNGSVITLPSGTATLLGTTGSIAGLTGTISSTVLGNSSLYVGTTSIALNRGSAAQGLTGITGLTPSADFTLTQNSVAALTSIESGAAANTLYLSAGKVGIGNTNPLETLGITGNASISGTLAANTIKPLTGALNLQYKSGTNAWTSGVTLLDNTGNVGIGNTNPNSKLDVVGSVLRLGSTTYPTSAYPAGTNAYLIIDKSGASGEDGPDASIVFREEGKARAEIGLLEDNDIHFKTITGNYGSEVFTDRMIIHAGGTVEALGGILRSSNESLVSGTVAVVAGNSLLSGSGAGLEMLYDFENTVSTINSVEWGNTYRGLNLNASDYHFSTGTSGSLTEVLTISGTNVGIGITAPRATLDVTGSASVSANIFLRGATTAHTFNILDNGTLNFQRYPSGEAANNSSILFLNNNGNVGIGNTAPAALLSVGSTSQFQVNSSGNVYAPALYLGTNESANGSLTLYSSGAGETDPIIAANATGDLTLSAATGQVIVGSGTGDIALSLTGAANILSATKVVTLAGAYTAADYTFNRTFTGDANNQGGAVFTISDTSGGAGTINPDMLVVNSALTSGTFTGNLLRLQVGGADKVLVDSAGKVGIGTTAPSVALHVVGNGRFTAIGSGAYSAPVNQTSDGTFTTATSDIRFKKDIVAIDDALSKVLSLRGVTFNWINPENPKRMMGMIAQEVKDIVPELVFQNPTDGYYGISYGETSGLLIEAIKEQQMQITSQGELLAVQDNILNDLQISSPDIAVFDLSNDPLFKDAQNKITDLQSEINVLSKKVDQELSGLVLGVGASGSAGIRALEAEIATQGALTLSDLNSEGLATVSGNLRVKGNGLIEGILNVIDTLSARDLLVSGIAEFFGNVVFKGDVEFSGKSTFNNDTAGLAVIKKDSDKVEITFDKEYENTPIVNVSLISEDSGISNESTLSEGYTYIISNRTTNRFVITLNKKAANDVTFSWIALTIKDAKRYESSN